MALVSDLATGWLGVFYSVLGVAPVINRALSFSLRVAFAQLARGPPVMAWKESSWQPSRLGGSVRASSFK